jgi:hypothetical protein
LIWRALRAPILNRLNIADKKQDRHCKIFSVPTYQTLVLKNQIKEIIPYNIESVAEGILKINKWAIPHWDEIVKIKPGSIRVSQTTGEYIIGRLKWVLNDDQAVLLGWLNYGWSVDPNFDDWKVDINFYRVKYRGN